MHRSTDLYVQDFYTWCLEQATLLEARDADALDWTHLAEEMTILAGSERRALRHHLQGVLMHLLKWQYQPEMRQTGHSWERSIRHGRREVRRLLDEGPGMQPLLPQLLPVAYEDGREDAADETHLPIETFPDTCPWTLAQVLAHDFWPES